MQIRKLDRNPQILSLSCSPIFLFYTNISYFQAVIEVRLQLTHEDRNEREFSPNVLLLPKYEPLNPRTHAHKTSLNFICNVLDGIQSGNDSRRKKKKINSTSVMKMNLLHANFIVKNNHLLPMTEYFIGSNFFTPKVETEFLKF